MISDEFLNLHAINIISYFYYCARPHIKNNNNVNQKKRKSEKASTIIITVKKEELASTEK